MPYYGDHLAGDPGLFGKIFKGLKSIRLGSIIGHAVLPGIGLMRSAIRAPVAPMVAAPTVVPGVVTRVSQVRAQRAAAGHAVFTQKGKALSAFARRRMAARRALAR